MFSQLRRVVLPAIVILGCSLPALPTFAAGTVSADRQFGPWICHVEGSVVLAEHPYKNGSRVTIGATSGAVMLFVDNPDLNLNEGGIYPYKADIDGDIFPGTARATRSTTLEAPLADEHLNALYNGDGAVVTASGYRYGMTLDGARRCFEYGASWRGVDRRTQRSPWNERAPQPSALRSGRQVAKRATPSRNRLKPEQNKLSALCCLRNALPTSCLPKAAGAWSGKLRPSEPESPSRAIVAPPSPGTIRRRRKHMPKKTILASTFAATLIFAYGVLADDRMTWQQRESWIIGEQQEQEEIITELASELNLAAGLIVLLPAVELGWLANCADAIHSGYGTVTIQTKIDRYQFLKRDLPYQWNILMQQLASNNPTEWHRFMQTQRPYLEEQERLRRQGSKMKHPTSCPRRMNPPPVQQRSAALPSAEGCTNMATCCADLKRQYDAAIYPLTHPPFPSSREAQKQILANAAPIEQQLQACRRKANGLPPLSAGGQPIGSAPTYPPVPYCRITGRC
jgi:hypothetical protein